jgi:Spy/CpxP family protein refolding chaperone
MKNQQLRFHNILLAAAIVLPLGGLGLAKAADVLGDMPSAAPHGERRAVGEQCGGGQPGAHRPPHGPEGIPPSAGMPPMGPGFMAPGEPLMLRGLDLSEAQQDKVFALLHAQVPYLREQEKAAAKAHEALRTLAGGAQYDDAKAASLSQTAAQAIANIGLQHARTEQKLLALLSPEQRKKLAESRPPRPLRN